MFVRPDILSELNKISRPGCSKLAASLANETLKFQTLISQRCQYFLLKKCAKASLIFSTKISVFWVIKS